MPSKGQKKDKAKSSSSKKRKEAGTSKSTETPSLSNLICKSLDYSKPLKKSLTVTPLIESQAVFVARSFLSTEECHTWIDLVERSGDLEYVSHPSSRYIAHRECSRWQCTDLAIARSLWNRIVSLDVLKNVDFGCTKENYQAIGCNGNIRFYKYEKGMSFGRHIDESNTTELGQTEVTVLIYLSNCMGGGTRFYVPGGKQKERSSVFLPEQGAILLHVHGDRCLEHEADPVEHGIKYVLRTDLVFGSC
mmetsp:Transcript_11465/g.16814  ORF Transcript_11465/g.16814 Transcript_11465/m.16814 type:complete len:248 (-) Transcript_11465:187-930(-)|eukprot:CAMPEP_0194223064 /NCGR_PEP_ID=MMETSP0156-20130528/34220_1 /TAXON_ID=33649 /ORGANISM="Thalassionema nitzschioides, Strain L26-B" /LENGTH=247 /DNA_ID=CAMNT_0038954071 /DNA_START=62 /DNA_END=805 /DNA_ORIENTATION=-